MKKRATKEGDKGLAPRDSGGRFARPERWWRHHRGTPTHKVLMPLLLENTLHCGSLNTGEILCNFSIVLHESGEW